ncbi:MAG: hypothetical protein CMJ78_23580 [Planctomycetaceae bacterium]|nr:hypothetical protein [Planctomycetaceae bacterium]
MEEGDAVKAPEWYQKLHEDHRDISRAKRVTILNTKRFFLHVFFFLRAVIRYGIWNVILFVPRMCWRIAFGIGRGVYESVTGTYLSADDAFQQLQAWTIRQIQETARAAWRNFRYPYYYIKTQSKRGVLSAKRTFRQLKELDFISLVLLTPFVFIRLGQATLWLGFQILRLSILIPIRVIRWLAVFIGKLVYETAHWTGIVVRWCLKQLWLETRAAWIQFKRSLLRALWLLPGKRAAETLLSIGATFVAAFVVLGKLIPWNWNANWSMDGNWSWPFFSRGKYAGSQWPWVFSTMTGLAAIVCLLLSLSDWTPETLFAQLRPAQPAERKIEVETPEILPAAEPNSTDIVFQPMDQPVQPIIPRLEDWSPAEAVVEEVAKTEWIPDPLFAAEPPVKPREPKWEPIKPRADPPFLEPIASDQEKPKPEAPKPLPEFPLTEEPLKVASVPNDKPLDPEFAPEPNAKPQLELDFNIMAVANNTPFSKNVSHSYFVEFPKLPVDEWEKFDNVVPMVAEKKPKDETTKRKLVKLTEQVNFETTVHQPKLKLVAEKPEPVAVGDYLRIKYRVENIGDITAEKVQVRTDVPDEFSHPKGRRVGYLIGNLEPGESYETYIYMKAEKVGRVRHRSRAVCSDATFEDIVQELEARKATGASKKSSKPPEDPFGKSAWAPADGEGKATESSKTDSK